MIILDAFAHQLWPGWPGVPPPCHQGCEPPTLARQGEALGEHTSHCPNWQGITLPPHHLLEWVPACEELPRPWRPCFGPSAPYNLGLGIRGRQGGIPWCKGEHTWENRCGASTLFVQGCVPVYNDPWQWDYRTTHYHEELRGSSSSCGASIMRWDVCPFTKETSLAFGLGCLSTHASSYSGRHPSSPLVGWHCNTAQHWTHCPITIIAIS